MTPIGELGAAAGEESGAPAAPAGRPSVAPAEWQRLIATHHRRVVLALVAAGFGFERAGELANEAWARLMEKDRQGRLPELRLPGLAIVQARFLAWDEQRREALRARHQQPSDGREDLVVDPRPDPEQRVLTRQEARRALEAVTAAAPSAQRLFKLLYAEPQMSHARAAEALGLSLQRVRQILCELRKRVRAALEGDRS